MKTKIILSFIVVFISLSNIYAQSFSFQGGATSSITGTLCNTTAENSLTISNSSSTPDTLKWIRTLGANWPSAWTVTTCDNNGCYTAAVTARQFIVPANSSANITMTIAHNNMVGTGTINLEIVKFSDTTQKINGVYNGAITTCINGINETKLSDVKFFPSPFQSTLNVRLNNNTQVKSVEFYNLIGSLVYKQEIANEDVVSVNAMNLPKGLYFVSLLDANRKILISKRIEKN
jgi:Secretion system C-terminal sorting domain